ncbi:MAG: chemotaxis protein CheW [Fusobacteriota bacterium]
MKKNIYDIKEINKILGIYEEGEQYISFNLLDKKFGVEIKKLKKMIGMPEISDIPNSPEYVEGLANYNGEIIKILNLHKVLNLKKIEYDKFTVLVILELDGTQIGILVDKIGDIFNVLDSEMKNSKLDIKVPGNFILGKCKKDNENIIILKIEEILKKII